MSSYLMDGKVVKEGNRGVFISREKGKGGGRRTSRYGEWGKKLQEGKSTYTAEIGRRPQQSLGVISSCRQGFVRRISSSRKRKEREKYVRKDICEGKLSMPATIKKGGGEEGVGLAKRNARTQSHRSIKLKAEKHRSQGRGINLRLKKRGEGGETEYFVNKKKNALRVVTRSINP